MTTPERPAAPESRSQRSPAAFSAPVLLGSYGVTSFMGGFAVMALEMCGFRVLATEYGSSVYTTGSLLTVIMAALAAGYYLGGAASRRGESTARLGLLLAASALWTAVADLACVEWILDLGFSLRAPLQGMPVLRQILPPAFAVLVLYTVPMVLLATITPFLVQRISRLRPADTGKDAGFIAGRLMALSTAGSILGTLVTSYVLIPQLGTRRTVIVFCVGVGLLALVHLWLSGPRGAASRAGALVLLLALGFTQVGPRPPPGNLVLQRETSYNRVDVFRELDDDGEPYLVYKPSRTYEHSVVYERQPLKDQLGLSYVTPAFATGARSFLVLGSAAGGIIRQLQAIDPSFDITGVEIDPEVLHLSRQMFGIQDTGHLRLEAVDARLFLRQSPERFDFIIVDLFAGDQLPPHCVTSEFFRLVRQHLSPNGSVFIISNMVDFPWSPDEAARPARPLRHLQQALRAAGFPSIFQNDLFLNGNLYAFTRPLSEREFRALLLQVARDERWPEEVRAEAAADALRSFAAPPADPRFEPFTDDWSPEDLLQLKGNLLPLARALPVPDDRAADPGLDLKSLTAAELQRVAAHERRFGVDEKGYCEAVMTWAARSSEPLWPTLARYFVPGVACPAGAPPGANGGAQWAATYTQALNGITRNAGRKVLPLLLSLAECDDPACAGKAGR